MNGSGTTCARMRATGSSEKPPQRTRTCAPSAMPRSTRAAKSCAAASGCTRIGGPAALDDLQERNGNCPYGSRRRRGRRVVELRGVELRHVLARPFQAHLRPRGCSLTNLSRPWNSSSAGRWCAPSRARPASTGARTRPSPARHALRPTSSGAACAAAGRACRAPEWSRITVAMPVSGRLAAP